MKKNTFNNFKELADFLNPKGKINSSKKRKNRKKSISKGNFISRSTKIAKSKKNKEKEQEIIDYVFYFIDNAFDSYESLFRFMKNLDTSSYDFSLFIHKKVNVTLKDSSKKISKSYVESNIKPLKRLVYHIEKIEKENLKKKQKPLFTRIIYTPMGNKR